MPRSPLDLLPACALVAACAGADANGSPATVRDSAGVTIVENIFPDSAAATWWSLEEPPAVDIGTLEGPEEQTLFRVMDAVRLPDGRIAVANGGTSEVRYYDATGAHVATAGRQGGGPGEFQRISSLVSLGGDSLAVVDGGARRVSVLDGSGTFVRDIPAGGPDSPVNITGRAPDGSWIGTGNLFVGPNVDLASLNGLSRRDILYVRIAADGGSVTDTVGTYPGSETFMNVSQEGGQIRSISIMTSLPFRKTTNAVVHGDELFVATQDAPEVRIHGLDGALRRIIRTGAPSPPVTDEMLGEWTDRRVASAPPERQQDLREATLKLPRGETVPPYGDIAVDRVGRLWVQDYPGLVDDPAWTIYDADGARVARITLPGTFRPYDMGEDWVLGRETDELEVEHVRLYRFGPAR